MASKYCKREGELLFAPNMHSHNNEVSALTKIKNAMVMIINTALCLCCRYTFFGLRLSTQAGVSFSNLHLLPEFK